MGSEGAVAWTSAGNSAARAVPGLMRCWLARREAGQPARRALLRQGHRAVCPDDDLDRDRPAGAPVGGVAGDDQPAQPVVAVAADSGVLAAAVAELVVAALAERARAGPGVEVLVATGGLVRDAEAAAG